jgi:hypothetical protein
LNGSDHVPGVIGRQRLTELSQDCPEPFGVFGEYCGTRRMERGAKILGLPFSVTPRHRSCLTPVPTYAHFTHGATTRPDIPRRLLSPTPVVLRLCRTCLWSRSLPHKTNPTSICSSLLCKSPPGRECLCVSSSAPSLDRRFYPRKEHETTSRFLISNL